MKEKLARSENELDTVLNHRQISKLWVIAKKTILNYHEVSILVQNYYRLKLLTKTNRQTDRFKSLLD